LVPWGSLRGNPICSFRQFFAKTYRFATIQNVTQTDDRTDRRHIVPKARPIRLAKNVSLFLLVFDVLTKSIITENVIFTLDYSTFLIKKRWKNKNRLKTHFYKNIKNVYNNVYKRL